MVVTKAATTDDEEPCDLAPAVPERANTEEAMASVDWNALMGGMLANDNGVRSGAEQSYHAAVERAPLEVLQGLLAILAPPDAAQLAALAAADPAQAGAREQARALSAVLLRQLLSARGAVWAQLDGGAQSFIRASLLASLQGESAAHVRRKVAHTVAELASRVTDDPVGAWPELLPATVAFCGGADAGARSTGLDLLGKLADYLGDAVLPALQRPELGIPALLNGCMAPGAGADVSAAALRAAAAIFVALPGSGRDGAGPGAADASEAAAVAAAAAIEAQHQPWVPLLGPMLGRVSACLNEGDELAAREALAALVDVAHLQPTFFKSALQQVGQAMLAIAAAEALDADTRQVAVELLLALAENAAPMMRRCGWLVEALLPLAVELLASVEGDEGVPPAAWAADVSPAAAAAASEVGQLSIEGEDEELEQIGARALDGLATALGGRAVLPAAFALLPRFLGDAADFRRRRAGVLTVAIIGGACAKSALMRQQLPQLVAAMAQAAQDPHPRVRGAALMALGQISVDFGMADEHGGGAGGGQGGEAKDVGAKEKKGGKKGAALSFHAAFAGSVLPLLLASLGGGPGAPNAAAPRLRLMAATAITNFCDNGCSGAHLAPALGDLCRGMAELLQSGVVALQQAALTAVARVAAVAKQRFAPHFDDFVGAAKELLKHTPADAAGLAALGGGGEGQLKQCVLLRCKALEAIAIIGEAVGAACPQFEAEAKEVLEFLLTAQQAQAAAAAAATAAGQPPPAANDLMNQYSVQVCSRLGRALGPVFFAPYLPLVLEPLLASLSSDRQLHHIQTVGDDVAPGDAGALAGADGQPLQSQVLQIRGMDNVRVTLDAAGIEEQSLAMNMLYEYACSGGSAFVPWTERVATAAKPLLTFAFAENVRVAAAATLPRLLLCGARAASGGGEGEGDAAAAAAAAAAVAGGMTQRVWEVTLPGLLECMEKEDETSVLGVVADCLCRSLRLEAEHGAWAHAKTAREDFAADAGAAITAGQGAGGAELAPPPAPPLAAPPPFTTPAALLPSILGAFSLHAQASVARSSERLAKLRRAAAAAGAAAVDDEDREVLDQEEEYDQEVLGSLVDCFGWVAKVHGEAVVAPFQATLLPWVQQAVGAADPPHARAAALCIVDDVLEFGGAAAGALLPSFLPVLAQLVGNEDDDVRRAATYGATVAARVGSDAVLAPQLPALLGALCAVPDAPGAAEEEAAYATDNAVSAIGRFFERFPAAAASQPGIWQKWQSWLPLQSDCDAARHAHGCFVKQVSARAALHRRRCCCCCCCCCCCSIDRPADSPPFTPMHPAPVRARVAAREEQRRADGRAHGAARAAAGRHVRGGGGRRGGRGRRRVAGCGRRRRRGGRRRARRLRLRRRREDGRPRDQGARRAAVQGVGCLWARAEGTGVRRAAAARAAAGRRIHLQVSLGSCARTLGEWGGRHTRETTNPPQT